MKLAITVRDGAFAGKRADFIEGFLTVGRDANCALRFDPHVDKVVSSKHAYVELKPDGFYLVDNKSTNGTFLNGSRVERARLSDGDVIQFGKNGPQATVSIGDGARAGSAEQNQPPNQFYENEPPPTQFQANQFQPPPVPANQFEPVGATPGNQQFQIPPPAEQFQPGTSQSFRHSLSNFGLKNPGEKPPESNTKKYLGIGLAILVAVFLSLIVIAFTVLEMGIVTALVATFVAFVPAMFYLLPLIWLDRYDPEPFWLLASAFAWGALVAVVFSLVVNSAIGYGVGEIDPVLGVVASTVVSAPIFEEASKGAGLLVLLLFFRRYFDDILDGIIFAGVIALGFATVENVLYYGRQLAGGGFGALMVLFVLRGVLSPFAHVTFTAMTGIGCGIARESHNKIVRIVMPVIGYGAAVFLHALWNGTAVFFGLEGFMLGYFILEVPFFLIFVGFAFYVMYRQNKILKEMLAIDVARGLITEEQLKTTTSAFRSSAWLLGSIFNGKYRARQRFLRSVGKLGLSYWHIQRATAAQGQTASFQQNPILREEVLTWRDKI